MGMVLEHRFGGGWTQQKLERLQKYLRAYATIMARQQFKYAYIDAFAGTGYSEMRGADSSDDLLFPDLAEDAPKRFLEGSARIALQIEPEFQQYIFIEKDAAHVAELEKLKQEYPEKQSRIRIEQGEANSAIQELCDRNWSGRRAVLFLDPYGMQLEWRTVEAIAATQAIDMWLLFPLGMGVNRMLKKDGLIDSAWRRRLDKILGTADWFEEFYRPPTTPDMFGGPQVYEKIADFEVIGSFFVRRLKTIFPGVAENPLVLRNSSNSPLYLLCFAAANPKGAPTAKKIAQDILKE